MSKRIKISDNDIEKYLEDIRSDMKKYKSTNGKVSIQKELPSIDRKATIAFTPKAWTKMLALLQNFDKEVAWHGMVERLGEMDDDVYLINDIVVYPQVVTGSNVETDQDAYTEWLMGLGEPGNDIRMQGHSHVNMACNPSSTDIDNENRLLSMMGGSLFYIFMIWNKRLEHTAKIYDLGKNVFFENSDITISLYDNNIGLSEFIESSKELVKERKYNSIQPAKKEPEKKKEETKPAIPPVKNACEDYDIMDYDGDEDYVGLSEYSKYSKRYNGYYR